MNDLIRKNTLLKAMDEKYAELERKHQNTPNHAEAFTIIDILINELPNVEPVRGEWKHRKSWGKYVCSVCSYEHDAVSNFCEQCGADMRGEKND